MEKIEAISCTTTLDGCKGAEQTLAALPAGESNGSTIQGEHAQKIQVEKAGGPP